MCTLDQPLRVPEDSEFLAAFGVAPVLEDADEHVYSVELIIDDFEKMIFSYSIIGRSVRCRWELDAKRRVDVFREDAESIYIRSAKGWTSLVVQSRSATLAGVLDIQVYPEFVIEDRLLYA